LPVSWEKLRQAIHGVGGDAGQNVLEIIEHVDLVALTRGDEGKQGRGGMAAVVAATEDPIFPSQRHPPQRVLAGVVVDRQVAVGGVDAQGVPLVEGVGDRLTHRALGQHRPAAGCLP